MQFGKLRRREFIARLGGAAAAWPLEARAQQDGRVRVVGILIAASGDDPAYKLRLAAFRETLARLGWVEGRNLRADVHYGTGDTERTREGATALVGLAPDVILVTSTAASITRTPVFAVRGPMVLRQRMARTPCPRHRQAGGRLSGAAGVSGTRA